MFKWLRNPFYRKVALVTLVILAVAIFIAALQAAWQEFQNDVDSVFPGGRSDGSDDGQWYEPVPTRDGLPGLDDDALTW